ncbi:substrate-binding domain-containing protein [Actinomadura sp. NPDC047616]|uniref:vWA domain-containing protein n=1 Tax=Actinomadura sp. NPDC047616 TaxID=3155914 RepID=UPI0033E69890
MEPRHHTIFCVDMVDSTKRPTDWHRRVARDGMYRALRRAFVRARLPWYLPWRRHREDRGDGALILVSASVPTARALKALPHLARELAAHNATTNAGAHIRLRVVLHAGEVGHDPHGVSGKAVDDAFRLLEAPEFKAVARETDAAVSVIVSDSFYNGVVKQGGPHNDPGDYRPLTASVRQDRPARAWTRSFPAPRLRVRVTGLSAPRRLGGVVAVGVVTLALLSLVPGESRPLFCDRPPVQVRVRVSAEKADVVQALTQDFESRRRREASGCRAADINVVTASNAGGIEESIRQGWLTRSPAQAAVEQTATTAQATGGEVSDEADVWLPDSSLEVEQLREVLRAQRIGTVTLGVRGSVTGSRLVVGVPRPMADELRLTGRQYRDLSWDEVLAWPQHGYLFGRASPRTSSTGLAATAALYRAALGRDVLNEDTLGGTEAATRLHAVEQAVARDDDEPERLLCAVRTSPAGSDLHDRTAVLVSQKALIDYRSGGSLGGRCPLPSGAAQPDLLTFVVQAETPLFDHPYVVINRTPQASPERRRVIDELYRFLLTPEAQQRFRDAGFHDVKGQLPLQDVVVTPRLLDLTGKIHYGPLLEAWDRVRRSADVLMAVDVSRAMDASFPDAGGTRLAAAEDAITRSRRLMGGRDQIALWTFARDLDGRRDHRSVVPLGPPDRAQNDRLNRVRLDTGGRGTVLYDPVRQAVRELRRSGGDGRGRKPADAPTKALIVIADGTDDGGDDQARADRLRAELLDGVPVRLYVLAFHSGGCENGLDRVAQAGGGACYPINDMTAMRKALDGVAAGLWGNPRRST